MTRLKNILVLSGALIAPCTSTDAARAQQLPDIVKALSGSWSGEGTLLGGDARFFMAWDRALNGAFARLTFHNARVSPNGVDTVLTAIGYYRPLTGASDSLTGIWLDTRGMMLPLSGVAADSTLTVWWGGAGTERGKTVYRVTGFDSAVVIDSVAVGGGWREFGRAHYRRR